MPLNMTIKKLSAVWLAPSVSLSVKMIDWKQQFQLSSFLSPEPDRMEVCIVVGTEQGQ